MRYTYFLLSMCYQNKNIPNIKNINIPACKNCIHYEPNKGDFESSLSKCKNFGVKNIITDKIKYDFADLTRGDENKCGPKGKYFIEEPNIQNKKILNFLIRNKDLLFINSFLILYTLLIIKYCK